MNKLRYIHIYLTVRILLNNSKLYERSNVSVYFFFVVRLCICFYFMYFTCSCYFCVICIFCFCFCFCFTPKVLMCFFISNWNSTEKCQITRNWVKSWKYLRKNFITKTKKKWWKKTINKKKKRINKIKKKL